MNLNLTHIKLFKVLTKRPTINKYASSANFLTLYLMLLKKSLYSMSDVPQILLLF